MLGKLIGRTLSLPVRIVNAPIKAVDRTIDWAMDNEKRDYRNVLDRVAHEIEDTCENLGD